MCADIDLLQIFFFLALADVFVSKETPASVQQSNTALQYFPSFTSWIGPLIQNLRNVPKAFKVQARGVCAR